MRRAAAALAFALLLAGCGPSGEPVELLTGDSACYLGGEQGVTGELVAGGPYGTMFNGDTVMWPKGYTGRRAGDEIEVLDADGGVRATTGRTYHIASAWASQLPPDVGNPLAAAVECGYPQDFVDCDAFLADARYCDPNNAGLD